MMTQQVGFGTVKNLFSLANQRRLAYKEFIVPSQNTAVKKAMI